MKNLSLQQKKLLTILILVGIGLLLPLGFFIKRHLDNSPRIVNNQKMLVAPATSTNLKGKSFDAVKKKFEDNGFSNITLEKIEDLIFGFLKKDGEVEEVLINGSTAYTAQQLFPENSAVVIRYHTFKSSSSSQSSSTKQTETTTTTVTTTTQQKQEDIITEQSDEEFAKIMQLTDPHSLSVQNFAKNYKKKKIKFTATVVLMMKHKQYNTRFDIALMASNEQGKGRGPLYSFENVNFYDLKVEGADSVSKHMTFEVVATIDSFDTQSKSIKLIPHAMTKK